MLNPITYTERVVGDFLRYQFTTYAFADRNLNSQMRRLLNLEETRNTPLLRGPYISLSRSFRKGAEVRQLADEGCFHPHMTQLVPYPTLFGHQEEAIRAVAAGRTTLVSTGTGSGKSEAFLYPIISDCLKLRDEQAPAGIAAIIVYPMNALAIDQLTRLRGLLAGSGITFGLYVGSTREHTREVAGIRLPKGASAADYRARVEDLKRQKQTTAVHPPEERVSREEMRAPGHQPRILLTNVKQLELLLTRQRDVELFDGAQLHYLVFDETHTNRGIQGAETACLIRRLRAYCGRDVLETACIGTSATIADPERGLEAGRRFASRFFGVPAEGVELVGESQVEDRWDPERSPTPAFPGEPARMFQEVLEALQGVDAPAPGRDARERFQSLLETLAGLQIDVNRWQESLYEQLAGNEVVYQIAQALKRPRRLVELTVELAKILGREIPEEEILTWCALGAASRKDDRPLVRPVVHGFVRGVSGAVVTFPPDLPGPKLWLSGEEAATAAEGQDGESLFRLPILTCTTCGQHVFVHHLNDFHFTGAEPEGGAAVDEGALWEQLDEAQGGKRVLLLDRLVESGEDGDGDGGDGGSGPGPTAPRRSAEVHFCRRCGAVHPKPSSRCLGCGHEGSLIALFALQQKQDREGLLTACVGCGTTGRAFAGRYREPARAVRAVAVSDVHVLSQSLIQHAERRRLLVFADNRQDAAFQAGWMKDHARRFRLRALMAERIEERPVSVGDLVAWLDDLMDRDDDLSATLLTEVWRVARKNRAPEEHARERKYFLRIQVLREFTLGARQRFGLEPWGRTRVEYVGLDGSHPFFQEWGQVIDCPPDELREGVAALLDTIRRKFALYDGEGEVFSKYWTEGAREVQRGYLPQLQGIPKGLKLRREAEDESSRVMQWLSARGQTAAWLTVQRFGVPPSKAAEFLEALWKLLSEELRILVPSPLKGPRGRVLPGCGGTYQINADSLQLHAHRGVYVCGTCSRTETRTTPRGACLAYRCSGTLTFRKEDPDNYDLLLLDHGFAMVRPEEHSAQIPHEKREELERAFKGDGERINTLVCTPTLELGVDIGALDAVLMRNVPPLPANYWQRAGRAGRRHRMAVNVTYARAMSHDRAYFADPLKMLEGLIRPPSFNLKNDVMIRKHVHATVLTVLHALARPASALSDEQRLAIRAALAEALPQTIRSYLFDELGNMLGEPLRPQGLEAVVKEHREAIQAHLSLVFGKGWPEEDQEAVHPDQLTRYVDDLSAELYRVIERLAKRLRWAHDQMTRLEQARQQKGTLDADEDALHRRCDRLIKKLKGVQKRRAREAEGYDDTNTYAVLAAEGFLPGYGLETGHVVGSHITPRSEAGIDDWELRRSLSLAIREYIPGNLIYANGHRFSPKFFHLEPDHPLCFQVDLGQDAVVEAGAAGEGGTAGLGALTLQAVPICDVDLPHFSHISDEEENRFRLSVAVLGYEQGRHDGGQEFDWGGCSLTHRRAVQLRLVNVGPDQLVRSQQALGYPLCLVCGQSRSPFASPTELKSFGDDHRDRCGKDVSNVGFYCDVHANALALRGCANRDEAFSLAESLRFGAAEVLDMELEDLQVLPIGRAGEEELDILLYDPMPGGSGLLEQMLERWADVVDAALRITDECASECERACVDCLYTFRNAYFHKHLDRRLANALLQARGREVLVSHEIPPRLPKKAEEGEPVNRAEDRLRDLLKRAGFEDFQAQKRIDLGRPLGGTVPDFFFVDPEGRTEGVCIYLDGLSRHVHGNPETQRRDQELREELRNQMYEVISIPASCLDDRDHMQRVFFRLGRLLMGRDRADAIRSDTAWFDGKQTAGKSGGDPKSGVPVFPLSALSGSDSPEPADHVELSDVEDKAAHLVVQLKGDVLSELAGTNGALLMRRPSKGEGWPDGAKVVVVRHPDLQDVDHGPGVGIGELRVSRRSDVEGNLVSVHLTLRPKTQEPGHKPLRLTLSPAEWGRLRPTAVFVRVMTEEERSAWSD